VRELFEIARGRGPLGGFAIDPPPWARPENGVVGLALAYNDMLVSEIVRELLPTTSVRYGTIEFSAMVATALRQVTQLTIGQSVSSSEVSVAVRGDELLRRWLVLSNLQFDRYFGPIELELTVAPGFPRLSEPRLDQGPEGYRLRIRHAARRSVLQRAQSGGRMAVLPPQEEGWGTLGGFVEDAHSTLYAMTAAHVVPVGSPVVGTPSFRPARMLGAQRLFQRASAAESYPLPRSWRAERGQIVHHSPPDFVPANGCTARARPQTSGLDIALAQWPTGQGSPRRHAAVAPSDYVSPALAAWYVGAYSGWTPVKVTGASIWHAYDLNERTACVADCAQIGVPLRSLIRTDVSSGGDSGSWLMAHGTDGPQWLGVLVGGDGERSGVVPADRIAQYIFNLIGAFQLKI
jgi:hypothetical protein